MNLLIRFLSVALLFFYTSCRDNTQTAGTPSPATTPPEWSVIGPGGGGGVLLPTISPFDDHLVLTHCDMTGAYISHDGGDNWRMFNLWTVPSDFEFDPIDPNTIYTATRGYRHSEDRGSGLSMLFRSEDRGKRWKIIYPDISSAKKATELQSTDLLPSELIPGALNGSIDIVEVDPSDNRHIFLGLSPLQSYMSSGGEKRAPNAAMLVHSTDYGATWNLVTKLPGKRVLGIFPANKGKSSGHVTVLTGKACLDVNIKNGTFEKFPLPVPEIRTARAGSRNGQTFIYIMSDVSRLPGGQPSGGLYISRDRGRGWKQINNGLLEGIPIDRVPRFRGGPAVCETAPEIAYLSTINPVKRPDGKMEYQYGVFKTEDAGKNWKPVLLSSSGRGYITKNYTGSWLDRSYDPGWGGSPINLGVAPHNPEVCYGGDNGRGYKTEDGGKTWVQVYSHDLPDGSSATGGLNVTTCYGVHFDPFDNDHFFISYTDIGLFHTFNGGKSWYHAINGIPRKWQNTCYWVVFDPDVKGRVWSVWANAHDLPRDKMFGNHGFDRFSGGVAISTDGGKTWKKSNDGMPENSVTTNILIDPESPDDARLLYVSVFGKGIYKSGNGGKSWKQMNNGLGENLYAWQLRRNRSGRIFALFSRGKPGGTTVPGALYYSDDRAGSWKPIVLPEGVNAPHDLLLDPEDDKRMYLSCWVHTVDGKDKFGGVLKTEDGGKTWRQVFDERIRVNSAGMNPAWPNVIFINTFQNAAFRSDDYGETWNRLEGYRFKWGQRAIPDINHPGMLYLTTYGGSVFYGPANGVPGAFEDIENMPESWW